MSTLAMPDLPPDLPTDLPPDLPLALPAPLLTGPFTTADARAAGVARHRLDAMLRQGVLRRIVRGVYVEATVRDTPDLRADALALVVDARAVAVDRTAAWLHGLDLPGDGVHVRDVLGRGRPGVHFGQRRRLAAREVVRLRSGVQATTPVRTALDLARLLAPARALATLDLALRTGHATAISLLAALPDQAALPGADRLPELLARADGRAVGVAESLLRHCWWAAGLPVPVPGLVVGRGRLALGLPAHRFGVVLTGADTGAHPGAEPGPLPAPGDWTVLPLPTWRIRHGDADLVAERLRTAFSTHLLGVHPLHDASRDTGADAHR